MLLCQLASKDPHWQAGQQTICNFNPTALTCCTDHRDLAMKKKSSNDFCKWSRVIRGGAGDGHRLIRAL
jgi:hypothetical protein